MFTPKLPTRLVTSATTPGRSGTGTLSSNAFSGEGAPEGRLRLASRARWRRSRRPVRSPDATAARSLSRLAPRPSKAASIASLFSATTSGQIPGCPAAMRVMSLKPPAASLSKVESELAASGLEGYGVGAKRPHDRAHLGIGLRRGALARRKHPRRAEEQVGAGTVDAFLFGTRHRVAAHKAGVVEPRHDRFFNSGHVCHCSRAFQLGKDVRRDASHSPRWHGHERHGGKRVHADLVDGT